MPPLAPERREEVVAANSAGQVAVMMLTYFFPEIALWLPNLVYGR